MREPRIIVVGGGLAGLMATIRVAEAGVPVDLFSIVPVKRSHSVCAQGGINAAKNQKGEGDSTWKHFDDTIFGGTLYHRTAFAGATTGQQLLYALDEQVRRHEADGKVKKHEGFTFLSAVIDEQGVCRGICTMDLRSMEVKTFAADAVIFCTGGVCAFPAGRRLREWGIHTSPSNRDSWRGQAPLDERVRARRRRARVGPQE